MNYVLEWLSYILMWVAGFVAQIFPADPFISSIQGFTVIPYVKNGMSMLNWFLPFASLTSTCQLVIGCVVSLYALKLCKWLIQIISEALPG